MNNQDKVVLNRMVDMMTRLQDFEESTLKQLSSLHKSLVKDLKKALKKEINKTYLSKVRMLNILNESQVLIDLINAILTEQAAIAVVEAGQYSLTTMNNIVSWDGKVDGFNNVALSSEKMLSLVTEQKLGGKSLNEWIEGATYPGIEDFKKDIQKSVIKGQGYKKTLSELLNKVDFARGSKEARNLETVLITYVQSINATAQQQVYQTNKDVVNRVEWSAIMENGNVKSGKGTCPRCMALDGMVWDVDSTDIPPHPLHARCRCMLLPVTKTWKELGFDIPEMNTEYKKWYIRDDDRKKLEYGDTDNTFADWWFTRNKRFQDNAIGPTRAALVRNGVIDFADIVDSKTGDLILLKDLLKTIGSNEN